MRKRLLAMLLACCMAAGMANAVFAAEDTPPLPDPPAVTEPAEENTEPTAAEPETEPEPTAAPEENPAPEPAELPAETPEPTSEPIPEPTEAPAPTETPNPTQTPEPAAEPEPTAAPTPASTVIPASAGGQETQTPESARELVMENLLQAPRAAVTAIVTSVELRDTIQTDGCFTAMVNGSADKLDGAVYTWYRSKNGTDWQEVTPQICSGTSWNIEPGQEHRLNAALDSCIAGVKDAERLSYKVEVTGTDGAKITAEAKQVPYYIQLQNGSFESPSVAGLTDYDLIWNNSPVSRLYHSPDGVSGTFFTQYPAGRSDMIWQTTGSAPHWMTQTSGLYIEVVDGTHRSYNGVQNDPYACYRTESAYDGEQFAELNCEAYGALYQDVLTVPGTTLHWSLAHRGRRGDDSMALLIAPVSVAQDITTILTQASADKTGGSVREALDKTVTYNGEQVAIRSFMVGGEMIDGNTQWGIHKGDYVVNAGQYVSRFFFLALSCASGDRREGNLLDKVWFSTEAEPPVAGHANLTVRKTIAGSLTADQLEAARAGLTFTVTRSDGTVTTIQGTDMTVDAAEPASCRYTLQDLPVTNDNGTVRYTYTVAETAHTAPAGLLYLASRTALNGTGWTEAGNTPQLAAITLAANATTYADFENTYALQIGSLRITKAVADESQRTEADAAANTFTVGTLPIGRYTLRYDDGKTEVRTLDAPGELTVTITGLHGVTIENLPVGRYTVTETEHPDLESYYCTTPADAARTEARVTSNGTAQVTITNTYAHYLNLTVTKQVTGGMGDTRRKFNFTAAVDGTALTADSEYLTAASRAALTETGFALAHRESITLTHLRPSQTVTVEEEALADYETSVTDGTTVTQAHRRSVTLGTDDAQLTYTNHKDGAPPTGLAQDAAPAVLMLLAGFACAALLRRRKED